MHDARCSTPHRVAPPAVSRITIPSWLICSSFNIASTFYFFPDYENRGFKIRVACGENSDH